MDLSMRKPCDPIVPIKQMRISLALNASLWLP